MIGLALPCVAADEPYYAAQSLSTSTATAPAGTATNLNVVLDVRHQANVAIQFKLTAENTNILGQVFWITRSVDGLTYSDVGTLITASLSGTAATASTTVTNFPTAGAGYLKINYMTNGATIGAVTNIQIKYGIKTLSP